jgi:DNA-binding CsgD family transcriptional regulator
MDTRGDRRLAQWLDVVADILQWPLTRWPTEILSAELLDAFEAGYVDWTRRDSRGQVQFDTRGPQEVDHRMVGGWVDKFLDRHPLFRWYAVVPDIRPQSLARVPLEVSPSQDQGLVRELLKPHGWEQVLPIQVANTAIESRAFFLMRGDTDYTDDDLELAARVQRLLIGLDKQIEINRRHYPMTAPGALHDVGLTGREQAVLALLAEGYTAVRIAHTLGVSQRTVHKHLENLYRKLQVPDRLSAVLQAQALSLLQPDTSDADVLTRPIS